ncbi:MAG: hypothetical protein NWE85_04890 [Candidatus Bathyarchaeota archaeon]|nr:hypothetical protein [Candidatus Bathyarchaeota archaeon]
MKTLEIIYWLRLALGITAAVICAVFGLATNTIVKQNPTYTTLLNGVSIALVIYLISYYIIKSKFSLQVEKPQKLLTMGIGIYFISWIVFWVLLYTIIATTIA